MKSIFNVFIVLIFIFREISEGIDRITEAPTRIGADNGEITGKITNQCVGFVIYINGNN